MRCVQLAPLFCTLNSVAELHANVQTSTTTLTTSIITITISHLSARTDEGRSSLRAYHSPSHPLTSLRSMKKAMTRARSARRVSLNAEAGEVLGLLFELGLRACGTRATS